MKKSSKPAFTLAEILATILIISVLIALILPVILRVIPDKDKAMTKKAYSQVETIIDFLIKNETAYPDRSYECGLNPAAADCFWGFDNKNSASIDGVAYSGDMKFPKLFMSQLNGVTDDHKCTVMHGSVTDNDYCYNTQDNITWDFRDWNPAAGTTRWVHTTTPLVDNAVNKPAIVIDVNGNNTGGNCFQAACGAKMPDTFRVYVYANGKLDIDPSDGFAVTAVRANTKLSN